jgi:hypothetical protein
MGLYFDTIIFYGCRVAVDYKALDQKLISITDARRETRFIAALHDGDNYLITTEDVFLVVPRTKKIIPYEVTQDDVNTGYFKRSKMDDMFTLAEIMPTDDEQVHISRMVDVLVNGDEKKEGMGKLQPMLMNRMTPTNDFTYHTQLCMPLALNE